MQENNLLVEVLSILIPVLIAAGSGALVVWRQIKHEDRQDKEASAKAASALNGYKLEVERDVWQRTKEQMKHQDEIIEGLRARIVILEKADKEKNKRIEELEEENVVLREALANGR